MTSLLRRLAAWFCGHHPPTAADSGRQRPPVRVVPADPDCFPPPGRVPLPGEGETSRDSPPEREP